MNSSTLNPKSPSLHGRPELRIHAEGTVLEAATGAVLGFKRGLFGFKGFGSRSYGGVGCRVGLFFLGLFGIKGLGFAELCGVKV